MSNVSDVAAKRAAVGKRVLPPVRARKAKTLRSIDDLLTGRQRTALQRDLATMAKIRRDAEATSSSLRLS